MKIKSLVSQLADFMLYVYVNYIKEDNDVLTNFGKIAIYPAWLLKSSFIWCICIIFIPEYLIKKSEAYYHLISLNKQINQINQKNK